MRESMLRIERLREERDTKEAKISEHLELINTLQRQLEDLAAENRTLRKMATVPDNYGMDLSQLKLGSEKKIENYTKLIKVLQDDNYKLEEERARLKHMLKQQSMLYTNNTPWDRYPHLTPDELNKVDQYVMKLKSGEAEEPADFYKLKKENTVLKAQLEALNQKGFEHAKSLIDTLMKELGLGKDGESAPGDGKLFDRLQSGNEEVKKMLKELVQNQANLMMSAAANMQNMPSQGGISAASHPQMMMSFGTGRFRPPMPSMGIDGDVSSGYSHKFQQHLEVADKDGKAGLGDNQTRYDVAFLQLQLMECFELQKRKDEELSTKNLEIDALYKRIREYLVVQDQLYKDFVKAEREAFKAKDDANVKIRNVTDSLHEEQRKVQHLQELVNSFAQGVSQQSREARIIELTKQNSILDINMIRLTRKYETVLQQEELLRRDFHNREKDQGEKDIHV